MVVYGGKATARTPGSGSADARMVVKNGFTFNAVSFVYNTDLQNV